MLEMRREASQRLLQGSDRTVKKKVRVLVTASPPHQKNHLHLCADGKPQKETAWGRWWAAHHPQTRHGVQNPPNGQTGNLAPHLAG